MSTVGEDLISSLNEAIAHARGEDVGARETVYEVPVLDIKALRKRLNMTQVQFASRFGFSVGTVRNWEQGLRRPDRAARLLLAIIDEAPELVHRVAERFATDQVAAAR